eukprot:jgi/Tetstr1/466120/TSEL_010683.t1
MSIFERYLSLWVGLGIVSGVILGNLVPGLFAALAQFEYASVNLLVAVLIWAMVYPMMVAVDFTSLKDVGKRPKGLVITIVVNWLIKPFTMAALGILFFKHVFSGLIPQEDLTKGDANYTLVQVSLNDVIMVFAFAPIVA